MRIPRAGDRRETGFHVAADDAARLALEIASLLERATGVQWYERPGNAVDLAALSLCRLRRARAGEKGGPHHGDEAARQALGHASTPAIVWLASRAISYMDESGFPEAVGPWFLDVE